MNLKQALRLDTAGNLPRIAFVGAGGKTTALFQLARQLVNSPYPTVLVSTTTHFSTEEIRQADHFFLLDRQQTLVNLTNVLPNGIVLTCGAATRDGRVGSLSAAQQSELLELAEKLEAPLLIEADGSKRRPIKVPAAHEPVIPEFVNLVIITVGLSCVGKKLNSDTVHRVEQFTIVTGASPGDEITPEMVARAVTHPDGGRKGIPACARTVVLLNQVDVFSSLEIPQHLAQLILKQCPWVLIASLQKSPEIAAVHEPIAGVILVAGSASRFNAPKQLLVWRKKPMLHTIVSTAIEGGLSPIYVVTGAYADEVNATIQEMPADQQERLVVVHNSRWNNGQSSSIQAALKVLSPDVGGCVFLLADQPLIPARLIQRIQEARSTTGAWIVAPRYQGRRGNPVLFGRELFAELNMLQGDTGGRKLLEEPIRYPVTWVDWQENGSDFDIDTPEDYLRLLSGGFK
jgi:molybdenum cofactor cytidylyltransferase